MRRRPACKRRSGNGCSLGRRRLPVAIHRRSPLRRSRSIVAQITRNRPFQVLAGAIVGAAAVLGFLLLWGGNAVQSVSAMEKMAENIRKVRSALEPDRGLIDSRREIAQTRTTALQESDVVHRVLARFRLETHRVRPFSEMEGAGTTVH